MTASESYPPWPGDDEKKVVEEMLRDPISGQWYECTEFVKKRVGIQAKNISQDEWGDIAQEAMLRISKSLHTFRFESKLKTWIVGIVHNCIVNTYRKTPHKGQIVSLPGDPHEDIEHERERDAISAINPFTPEDISLTSDELRSALLTLKEYIFLHRNQVRNRRILEMVLLEGHSHVKAAEAVGCSAPVASYVIREAQRYVREKLGYRQ